MATEIDRQALMELQEKLGTTQAFHSFLTGSQQRATVELRRTELTLEELSALPDDVVTFKPVGKAYLLAPKSELQGELQEEAQDTKQHLEKVSAQKEHTAKTIEATRTELQELVRQATGGGQTKAIS